MIKFFRKIRQNMIKENKVSKYVLYAIGEIVLVVIGILIAISINNWNEQRIQQHKAAYYLVSIVKDLESNVAFIKTKNTAINNDLKLLEAISHKLTNDATTMDTLIKIATEELDLRANSYTKLNENTYQTLQNTGHIQFIDTWLQEELQQINFIQNDLYETNEFVTNDYSSTILEFLKYFPGNTINKELKQKVYNEFSNAQRISAFSNLIWFKRGMYHSILRRSEILEEKTTKLLDTMEILYSK